MTNTDKKRPLANIRVVDFTTMMAGPYATRYLADLGAEVIKIETAEGDYLRSQAPLRDGQSTYFAHLNAGKKSVVLNLKNPDDIKQVKALIATADLVVENFRPGVMRRFGLDADTLRADNPRLIFCAISGYGQTGPGADVPAYAQTVHASSGYDLANLGYQDELTRPAASVFFYADVLAAIFALGAINAALYQREVTGEGQLIDLSLMESAINMMPYEVQEAQFPAKTSRPIYKPLRTSDGFIIAIPNTQRNFELLAGAMGHNEWITDDRFKDLKSRYHNYPALLETLETWTSVRTAEECVNILTAASVPCARYRTVREAMEDPQLKDRSAFATVEDTAGAFLIPNLPFKMSLGETTVVNAVPALGENTIEEFLNRKPGA